MHHNLITAIFMTSMTNMSNVNDYKYESERTLTMDCDMKKTCMDNMEDIEMPFSTFTVVNNIVLTVVGVFGIVGNVLSIIVLSRPQMKSSNNYLLLGLTVCDTFVVTFAIMIVGFGGIFSYTGFLFRVNFFYLPYIYVWSIPIWYTAQVSSVYLTIAVTIERYIAVCYPLKAKILFTTGVAKRCIFFIILASFVYHIPTFWENGIMEIKHDECNFTLTCAYMTGFGQNHVYFTIYWEWLHSFFTFLLPFSTLAFLNISIVMNMKKAYVRRRELSGSQKIEQDQTKILLYIVAVFFIFNSTFPALYLYHYFFSQGDSMIESIVNQTAMSMFVLNSCVNFIIYLVVGRKFKKVFLKTFLTDSSSKNITLVFT